ncbi:MAG TPA: serine/threonine-protein kinase [Bryobacteraceae bacterium]|nr:serine/threonine-protein kinase [Bryobacteraceae bacterium]
MVGRIVRQYQLVEKLGAGGMGEVYKARDTHLNRAVAIKVLIPGTSADEELRRRFLQEAQAASALNHPNIITIYDIFTDDDIQFMVSEYVDGKTLLELIATGSLSVPLAIEYAIQMADALSAAHSAGTIHRDIKPANVMVTTGGLVKVLDFGLAKFSYGLGENTGTTATVINAPLTVHGAIMGTVNYMSPEQAEGKTITTRSDIFSFGAVLYEMLTGRSAFRGSSTLSTLSALLRDDVQPLIELAPGVPYELEAIVTRCLKKSPDERFQSMREVYAALVPFKRGYDSGIFNEGKTIRTMAPPPPAAPRASKLGIGAAIAVLAIGAAAGGYWWVTHSQSAPPTQSPKRAVVATPAGTLTNDSIVEMAQAKIEPDVIIGQIRAAKTNFNLSTPEIIRLSKAGVPSEVLEAMRDPHAAPAPAATPVMLADGSPIQLVLTSTVPDDAQPGDVLRFRVAEDVVAGGLVAIAKGAVATGSIVDGARKKLLIIRGKMTFRLDRVEAVDGQTVPVRATPERHRDGSSKRTLSTEGGKPEPAGAEYTGYVDGTTTVMVKK